MSNTLVNLARVQSTTLGQGTLTLGAAIAGFNTFSGAGLTDGQTVTYCIEDYNSDIPATVSGREIGQGVYSAGTLTRATVYSSTLAGAKLNCSGRQHVFITAAAEDIASFATDLTAHLNDTAGAHAASAISFSATGNISSTDVQAAIAELDSEKLSTATAASTYQPLDSDLTTLAANITAFGHSLVDDATAAAARTTMGLGTAAVQNTGTSGATIPFLNAANTWSANQTLTKASPVLQVNATSGDANFYISAVSGSAATARWGFWNGSAYVDRWLFGKDATAESGTNAGSNFAIYRYDDAGAFLAVLMTASRADGSVNWRGGLYSNGVTGGSQGNGTLNFGTLYENGTSLASKYQGLDSELTAIAGLTSAADRLPYFTGSGTASLATFTTAGRALVDDADASAQRTTLGLGTAATQATGTSGATLPFLNGTNTWSGAQTISTSGATSVLTVTSSASFAIPFTVESTNADNLAGPFVQFYRNSASPAAADRMGAFNFRGNNSTPSGINYVQILSLIDDPTAASEDGRFRLNCYNAGTLTTVMEVGLGATFGAPTGGDKGTGTVNAKAVYDDSALLCAPVEFMKSGSVNTATWDAYAIDETVTEGVRETEETIEIDLDEPEVKVVDQRDGTYKLETVAKKRVPVLDAKPVLDDKGEVVGHVKVPRIQRTVVPAKTIPRRNELAHEFKAMLDEGFDPRDPEAYFDKMLADEALPGLKTKANWVPNEESNAKRTNRIILALELQTAVVKTLYERLEALEKKVKP